MPKIKEILNEERNHNRDYIVLFLEGLFWRAYEYSAYVLSQQYGFKPTKKMVKLINEEIISVGFPKQQLTKYVDNIVLEKDGKLCKARIENAYANIITFEEWKQNIPIKQSEQKTNDKLSVPKQWQPKVEIYKEENLPVFKLIYDLLLRVFNEAQKMTKDFRYTIGENLKTNLLRIVVCIYHANDEKEISKKITHIADAIDKLLEVKLLVRILHDCKQISLKKYALLCEQIVVAEKHLKNWKLYNLKLL